MIIKKRFREKVNNAIRVASIYILSLLYAIMGPSHPISALGIDQDPKIQRNNMIVSGTNYLISVIPDFASSWQSRNWIILLVLSNRRLWKITDFEFDQIGNLIEINQPRLSFNITPSMEEIDSRIFSTVYLTT